VRQDPLEQPHLRLLNQRRQALVVRQQLV